MPSLMTTAVLTIEYTPRASDLCYDIRLSGQWVASATTFHAADEVADEVRYRTFLNSTDPIDDEPGDDCPEHGPFDDDDCPKCDDDEAMEKELYQVQKHGNAYVVVDTKANFVLRLATTKEPMTFAAKAEAQAFAGIQNAAYRRHGPK